MRLEGRLLIGFFIAVTISFILTGLVFSNTQLEELFEVTLSESQSTLTAIYRASTHMDEEDFYEFLDDFAIGQRYQIYLVDMQMNYFAFGDMKDFSPPTEEEMKEAFMSDYPIHYTAKNRNSFLQLSFDKNPKVLFLKRNFHYERIIINKIIVYGIISFSLAGTLVFMLLAELIVQPIKKLIKATKQLSNGDYNVRVIVDKRTNEMAALSENFNLLAYELGSLEQKRQQFVSDISHEFQTPITSIQGFANILKDDELSEEQRQKYLEIIIQQSQRLSLLSKNMIQLTMLEDNEHLDINSFQLKQQILNALLGLEPMMKQKGIEYSLTGEEVNIEADIVKIEQVFVNLITNAIKYSNQDGQIHVAIKKGRKDVTVTIEDHGIGIQKEVLHRIYERFYRGDKARHVQGSGLGLTISKRIVDLHQGYIKFESVEHEGTKVYVVLPLVQNKNNKKSE